MHPIHVISFHPDQTQKKLLQKNDPIYGPLHDYAFKKI